jgi:hypothetical protein
MTRQNEAEEIGAFINILTAELQEQAAKAGSFPPMPLIVPEPINAAEKTGLTLFLETLKEQTGAEIKFVYRQG